MLEYTGDINRSSWSRLLEVFPEMSNNVPKVKM